MRPIGALCCVLFVIAPSVARAQTERGLRTPGDPLGAVRQAFRDGVGRPRVLAVLSPT